MIIPMVCFTCGLPIAHLYEQYLELVKQDYLAQEKKETTKTPEFKALAQLKIGRECCRRMFLCHQDMYHLVK